MPTSLSPPTASPRPWPPSPGRAVLVPESQAEPAPSGCSPIVATEKPHGTGQRTGTFVWNDRSTDRSVASTRRCYCGRPMPSDRGDGTILLHGTGRELCGAHRRQAGEPTFWEHLGSPPSGLRLDLLAQVGELGGQGPHAPTDASFSRWYVAAREVRRQPDHRPSVNDRRVRPSCGQCVITAIGPTAVRLTPGDDTTVGGSTSAQPWSTSWPPTTPSWRLFNQQALRTSAPVVEGPPASAAAFLVSEVLAQEVAR